MSKHVFVVVGAKGGCGGTTLAAQLAQLFVANKLFGTVAVADADLSGRRSLGVLLDAIRKLDQARGQEGIAVLPVRQGLTAVELAPSLDAGFTLRLDDVEQLASAIAGEHDAVVVDSPQPFAAAVRPFIVRATRFLLLTEPTLLSVTAARMTQMQLQRFGIPAARLFLVAVSRDGRIEVSRSEIESALQLPCCSELPPLTDKRHARALRDLAEALAALPGEEPLRGLAPSTEMPIGNRRAETRRGNAASNAGERAAAPPDALAAQRQARRARLKADVHEALAKKMDSPALAAMQTDADRMGELRESIAQTIGEFTANLAELGSAEDLAHLRQEILDEAIGLGPLEELLRDPAVTEIMVNGWKNIYIEREGKIERTSRRFTSDKHLRLTIERIIAPLGRRIDEAQPMVDARLPDGSRVNAIIEPLAIDGPSLTIRKFGSERLTGRDLIRGGACAQPMLDFLRAAVEARLNVVISGGTGSGKTTLLNIISNFLPPSERIVTIEDAAELFLDQEHVVRLEARPPNLEMKGEIRIRDLVRNALRMRPDRIIVGECRGGEAFDMLQAMNTGHDGSMTTVHANGSRDALSRIETMVLMAGLDLPMRAIREQVASAVDLIVQTARLRDGSRKIVSIAEVVGMEGEVITTQEIVRFHQAGVDKNNRVLGSFQYTGVQPLSLRHFEEIGISFDPLRFGTMEPAAVW